ncbi:polysaccharide deacetylase family protein [Salipaludibacillus aurantiacus]|uniref:Peptidoglycan/xylan/chitin deacetylase, PgdA/CDA1 family n=1 Tax=Salipaludibacillus aurantiacus TaxID=1601833 RepID=A0A1H9X0N3_9BACI|nr:polysaccharide deacetylase family protein [Salipaludibacillus aurantiacus]SES39467.1 Peptidoglycan/xylan/chitin deacetylase, PgdA/CDA1 family [Salipaludibacillus aurantiacus]
MKKAKFVSICVLTAGLLIACGDNNEKAINGNENNNMNSPGEENLNNQNTESANSEEKSNANELNENADNIQNEANENINEHDNELNGDNEEDIEPLYQIENNVTVRPIDEAPEEVVLLTIDDAPDNYGVEMAEILQDMDAGAIFFVNGHFLQSEEGQQQLKDIYELGFEIGNHTMTHPNLSDLSEEEQYEEIVELNDLVEDIIGERPRFFRAPFGVNTDYSKQLMEEEEMQWMNWSYGYDYFEEYMEAEALEEIMVETEHLGNGANLLMHDREFTKDALKGIVEGLREKGYEIVDPEMIK